MYWTHYDKNFLITIDISQAVKYLLKIPKIVGGFSISLQGNVCLTKRYHRTIKDGFERDILDNLIQTLQAVMVLYYSPHMCT